MRPLYRALAPVLAIALVGCSQRIGAGPRSEADAIEYTLRFASPESHMAEIEMSIPTDRAASLEVMLPVWSPGFYQVENYAENVRQFTAHGSAGELLASAHSSPNRWRVETAGQPRVTIDYTLACEGHSVTTNWVGPDYLVLNGPATFMTPIDSRSRTYRVRLCPDRRWPDCETALERARGGAPNEFAAPDYDTLVDSPIVAGRLSRHEFSVNGARHVLVDVGAPEGWDGQLAADRLRPVVEQHARLMGGLPFRRYVFLNVFRAGGGGLEHCNSTLLTTHAGRAGGVAPGDGWLKFVSHEYFHAFNVKRLRPIELGPFDYEKPPRTSALWIAEGWTSYFGNLAVDRSREGSRSAFLRDASNEIRRLQTGAGRLKQSLEQASLTVWDDGTTSGVGGNRDEVVDYYNKGFVVAFLLDAKIRRSTGDRRSLDDLIRLAYRRFGGAHGFTADQFEATAGEVAGTDLREFFRRAVRSTEELDYAEMLEWYGLRFTSTDDADSAWTLTVREDATADQGRNLDHLVPAHVGAGSADIAPAPGRNSFCANTTSIQRPNLNPTSRSRPTSVYPAAKCSRRLSLLSALMIPSTL
ncbi:MAG: hypothetical protein U1D55_09605 [Phycisphaerae bacterium]